MSQTADIHFMRQALSLARRGLGRTWPNPSVGCVIVKNGVVIAVARTADGGRPHAEALALENAGARAKGATLYVTLEPCAHQGQTAPCVEAIIKAAPVRVVIAVQDVDPRVAGKGVDALKAAGIEVTLGVLEDECRAANVGFFRRLQENRPFVTLKIACSLDGKIALGNGQSQWVTGELARRHVHSLRARHDAILVGIGTALADDPLLTTRVDGIVHKPVRIVLDSKLQLSVSSRLVKTAKETPLWIFHTDKEGGLENHPLSQAGVRLFSLANKEPERVLNILAQEGITRLLIEGGPTVMTEFLQSGLWDELHIYRAPKILDGDTKPAFGAPGFKALKQRENLKRVKTQILGEDLLEIYSRTR